jgi:hypothetical protein
MAHEFRGMIRIRNSKNLLQIRICKRIPTVPVKMHWPMGYRTIYHKEHLEKKQNTSLRQQKRIRENTKRHDRNAPTE